MQKQNYIWLDLLRGFAALVVLLGHSSLLMLKPFAEVKQNINILYKIFVFVAGMGYQFVMVFFVLSGFFIVGSIHKSLKQGSFSFIEYYTSRLSRLWMVLIPALFLGFILDKIGSTYLALAPYYSNAIESAKNIPFNSELDIKTFLGNMFFLQSFSCKYFGSNVSLWSLSFEWWFYVIIPFLLLFIMRYNNKKNLLYFSFITLLIVVLIYNNINFLPLFMIWLIGGLCYFLNLKISNLQFKYLHLLIAILLFVVIMSVCRLQLISLQVCQILIGLSCAYLIIILTRIPIPKQKDMVGGIHFLSKISFTLYAVHFPVVVLVSSSLGFFNLYPDAISLSKYFSVIVFTILLAYVLWYIFERNTYLLKNSMVKTLNKIINQ